MAPYLIKLHSTEQVYSLNEFNAETGSQRDAESFKSLTRLLHPSMRCPVQNYNFYMLLEPVIILEYYEALLIEQDISAASGTVLIANSRLSLRRPVSPSLR